MIIIVLITYKISEIPSKMPIRKNINIYFVIVTQIR
jgi:hypothetical protein